MDRCNTCLLYRNGGLIPWTEHYVYVAAHRTRFLYVRVNPMATLAALPFSSCGGAASSSPDDVTHGTMEYLFTM